MQAIVFEQFGEPADVLKLRDVPAPEPRRNEVRVRMLASPVNPSDLMTVRGIYGKRPTLPATPGFEGVGVVETSGGSLFGKLLVGRRVSVLNSRTGNWGEQAIVTARQAIPLPAAIPDDQAAMFFVNPATAYIMTRKVLAVRSGAWLLQTAAGSALGRMVIRLGRHFGFRTLNVVRREAQVDELRQLGADEVLVFDAQQDDVSTLRERVMQLTDNRGVPCAIDPVGGATGSAVVKCLATGGRMLVYGTLSDDPLSFSPRELMTPGASIAGFWLARYMDRQSVLGKLRLVRDVSRLIRAGVLDSDVGQTFPLAQIADAVKLAEQPGRGGKVLLRIREH